MSESLLDKASDFVFAKLKLVDGDISRLAIPLQTVAVIYSAQGVIDNGGLEYFYESDFNGTPEYSFFVEAYRRIGAECAASCIQESAAMFPFAHANLYELKRQRWLDTVKEDESHAFAKLSRKICSDQSVFSKLGEYVAVNRDSFQI